MDITEHLMNEFRLSDLKVSRSTVHKFIGTECSLSLKKKAESHSVERNSLYKINEYHDCVREWDEADRPMNFLTNCVFLDESHHSI